MTDEDLDPKREEADPCYLEDTAVKDDKANESKDERKEYVHDPEVHGRDYRVEGNDIRDYIGVDPEYMTYANPSDAPILTDTERFNYTDQYDHLEGNADDEEDTLTEEEINKYGDRAKEIQTETSASWYDALRRARDEDLAGKDEEEPKKPEGASEAPLFPAP